MWNEFKQWCLSETAGARFSRTVVQGVISTAVTFLPDIVTGSTVIPAEYKAFVVAMLMCVLSPAQKALAGEETVEGQHVAQD